MRTSMPEFGYDPTGFDSPFVTYAIVNESKKDKEDLEIRGRNDRSYNCHGIGCAYKATQILGRNFMLHRSYCVGIETTTHVPAGS